jgi:hypothetical protein
MNNGLSIPRAGAGSLGIGFPSNWSLPWPRIPLKQFGLKTKFEQTPAKSRAIAAVVLRIVAAEIAWPDRRRPQVDQKWTAQTLLGKSS